MGQEQEMLISKDKHKPESSPNGRSEQDGKPAKTFHRRQINQKDLVVQNEDPPSQPLYKSNWAQSMEDDLTRAAQHSSFDRIDGQNSAEN